MIIAFPAIAAAVLAQAKTLLPQWFPNGRFKGAEWTMGDIDGKPGTSLQFNVDKGYGTDFASGAVFGDIIDLYAQAHRLSLADAARTLEAMVGTAPLPPPRKRTEPQPLQLPPVQQVEPDDLPTQRHGKPDAIYHYRAPDGSLRYVVARYESDADRGRAAKLFAPWVWSTDTWACRAPAKPRPLFGLETIVPGKRAIIVEGEKAALAARKVFPTSPVLTWANGAQAVAHADWNELVGLVSEAVIWPDHDEPGRKAGQWVAEHLQRLGIDCWMIDTSSDDLTEGWDIADMVEAGMSAKDIAKWATDRRASCAPVPPPPPPPPPPPVEPPAPALSVTTTGLDLAFNERTGKPANTVDNVVRVLDHLLPETQVHYDSFLNSVRYYGRGLEEADALALLVTLERDWQIPAIKKTAVFDALLLLATRRRRNCLQEWINQQEWDHVPRVDSLFLAGFGVADTAYHRQVGRNFLLGMVARAHRPGCQVDTLPILEGAQGIGKSRGLAALGGEWYADIDEAMGSKAFAELIQGKWLVELSELAAMRPSEVERVKAGITRSDDVYRVPFERYATSHPRQCVFAGSTNAVEYLQDSTGNRRFLPVKCGTIDRGWISHHRGQLFAEAAHRLAKGENWWTMDATEAEAVRAIRAVTDSLADPVAEYLVGRTECRIADILAALEVPTSQWTSGLQRRLAESLRQAGWRSMRRAGGATWWVPVSPETKSSLRIVETRGSLKVVETNAPETKHSPYKW